MHRRPAQHPGVQADLAVPLQAAPQPPGADPVEPHRVPAHRLVIAQRNPVVLHRVPLVPLPPRAGVGGGDEQTHHPRQQPADVVHRGSRRQPPAAAVHHTLDLLAPLRHGQSEQGGRRPPATIGDHLTEPAHQHAQPRCRDLPAQLDDAEHTPRHLPAHRLRQLRQVHPGPPGPVVAERSRVLRWDTRLGEARQPHRFRHRRPQVFQRPRVAAAAGRFHPVDRGRFAPAGHESDPIGSSQCAPTRQPAVNAFQSATARISASSVTCA